MKTENKLNYDILKMTMRIQEKLVELSEYKEEMPVVIPDTNNPQINIKILQGYNDSLDALLKKYRSVYHKSIQ